jgi:transposase
MEKAWLGVDAGKEFHWAHMLDASGQQLLSRKVENDEADISALIDEALSFAEEVDWAVDQPGGGAALLLALLWERDQRVLYVPGLSVDRARDTYRGESKSDARDARVIADQARMRGDLGKLKAGEQEIAELQLLLARRRDLVTDQSRTITRLREALVSLFPALERALDLNSKGPLTLLTHYHTPDHLRRAGHKRIAAYLRSRGVKGSNSVAQKALAAAKAQSVTLPAQDVAAAIVAELAEDVLGLKERINTLDEELGQRFFARPEARILTSLPGMGERSSGPSSWSLWATSAPSLAPTGSPPTRVLSRQPVTPASGWVSTAGCEEGTRSSSESSTSRHSPAYAVLRSPGPSTIARGQRARGTLKLSSPWRVGGSTSSGRCCVTEPRSRPDLRLDIFIEILPRPS